MSDRVFVDTNVLVYAHDRQAGVRHEVARELVASLWATGAGIISTQVLQELYVIVSRKILRPLEPAEALQLIEDYRHWKHVVNDAEAIVAAIALADRYRISFWDALIVNAANQSKADMLYSEDLNPGQRYGSVVAHNPFADA